MKRTIKKAALLMFVAVFGFTGFVFADTPAGNIQGPEITKPTLRVDPNQLRLATDLGVEHIFSNSCLCTEDLASVGAFLMNDMWVSVTNRACTSGAQVSVSGKLKIAYFDMVQGRMLNRLVNFSVNKNGRTKVKAVSGYVLVKKSTGIKAEIHEINPSGSRPVTDCNSSNDSLTVHRCMPDLVY